ncbi:hypothetical protein A7J71_20585 [Achromobacter insolitus]|uniref:hypothetical protein n=1 Tax=Achromobacter insolitus TaxID=217204 RepID=UPI0007C73A16|nr:hypothetical protein [Achromobacter insolitus]OAE71650.1 hypothetical protein A7J71_20585 [Achromobacter insolitus]OCZ52943.1 hypothetical protein A7P22_16265 [Achromobacter insolitus]
MSRVVLGDCLSILPTLPDRYVDMVLTDLPYLVNYQDRAGRSIPAMTMRDLAALFTIVQDVPTISQLH